MPLVSTRGFREKRATPAFFSRTWERAALVKTSGRVKCLLLQHSELAGNTEGLLDADHVAAREQNAPGVKPGAFAKSERLQHSFQELGSERLS